MSLNYAYTYAEVMLEGGLCIGVVNTTDSEMDGYVTSEGTKYVSIPVNDANYMFKYYINGEWYEDAAGTIPWTSSLL